MNPAHASRTALATSLMRAVHSRHDPQPLIDDLWGERFVPEAIRTAFPATALRANAAYADVVLRARYTEDALREAVARGVSQYVVVGAGFDSFAWRRPAWAEQLMVYEVDHPTTQGLKRERLKACAVPDSVGVQFIAADLAAEDLGSALARSSFDRTRPAFFSWLGVTMYLSREANLAVLRAMAACAAGGSELVFSYVDEAVFDPAYAATDSFKLLRSHVASSGEAFQSGFDPAQLHSLLEDAGLQLLEDLDGMALLARYDAAGANGLQSNPAAHIAHARVTGAALNA
jgi:methyltransferase (TIGR00027 family)